MRYTEKEYRYISERDFKKLNCNEIFTGCLLINRIVSGRMNACILPKLEGKFTASVDVCHIAGSELYSVDYLLCAVSSSAFQKQVLANSNGTMLKRINKSSLVKIRFGLPPLNEQRKIAKTVFTIFGQLEELKGSLS